jgi:hypothetical protein
MLKQKIGRFLLTVVLVSTALSSVAADWNTGHLFNDDWPPHARFHDFSLLQLLCGVCVLGLWLLWRRSPEPEIGVRVAALIPIIYRSAFFYTTFLIPGTSLSVYPGEAPPQILGIPFYPSVLFSLVSIILAIVGYWLFRSGTSPRKTRLDV